MIFCFQIGGFGFTFAVLRFDPMLLDYIVLSWQVIKNYEVWRSETHARGDAGYRYKCVKNGKTVEDLSFRSPVVNRV